MKTGVSQSKDWKSKARYVSAAGMALIVSLAYISCGGTPRTRYYTLQVPPPPGASGPKTHSVLQIERFESPDVLRDNRIIYYTSPNELNFHQYHRWSSDPSDLLTELTMKYFAEAGLFQEVYSFPAPVRADYTLRGRVVDLREMKFEKDGGGKSGVARVGLKLDLLQTRQNKVVWSARLEQTAPIEQKGVRGVVSALNVAADRLMQNAYVGISQVVEQELAQQKQGQAH